MEPVAGSAVSQTMHCMEIRGGSRAVENTVSTPGLDAWVFSQPHEGAASGGDVYYVSLCGGGVITRLVVADVSGHGMAVAEFSKSLRGLVRRHINHKRQTRLVRSLNQQFTALARMKRFATAVLATYLATRDTLEVCNAGHPRPLWYQAATGQWSFLSQANRPTREVVSNLPLGLDQETSYDQFTVVLGQGDFILLYTDALIEARNEQGELVGEEGLLNLVRELDVSEPRDLGSALLTGLERYRGGQPPDDDVTLLVVRHNAGPPRRLSVAEKLDVYAKVFGLRKV